MPNFPNVFTLILLCVRFSLEIIQLFFILKEGNGKRGGLGVVIVGCAVQSFKSDLNMSRYYYRTQYGMFSPLQSILLAEVNRVSVLV